MSDSGRFGVVIPARYASTRLPGKPLCLIAGCPLILHVHANAVRSGARFVIVATDDERISEVVREAGGEAMLTSSEHASGTDRAAEVVRRQQLGPDEVVVNLQGDEPFIDADAIRRVAETLIDDPQAGIATLATPTDEAATVFDPNVVKVVTDRRGRALYFSRAPIPWAREHFTVEPGQSRGLPPGVTFLHHIGMYAYRVGTLLDLSSQPQTELEKAEQLEQLRALSLGIVIRVEVVKNLVALGVDTEDDLLRARSVLGQRARAHG